MERKKHYQIVDKSIVFFTEDAGQASCEIEDRIKELFKGATFHNTFDHTIESAEGVSLCIETSQHTGDHYFVVKAHLRSDVPVDLEIRFVEWDTTLQYIDGRFVHVEEYKFSSSGGPGHIELLLPGETKPSTRFETYIFENL